MFGIEEKYRDLIRDGNENVKFLFLEGSFDLVLERMKQRKGHYMKTDMLKSQFDTLEVPQEDEPDVIHIDIDGSFETVVERCVYALKPLL
ncbi:thermosensitive gluconokinase [Rodentibacter pneumotropicus]|uniref:gluconokinase n=1 Tax=Rodentibacter pneumotropicus TaxID=758 RepID=A0A3S4U1V6_9PAST|nr:thermosensitive gluconokinase [Rodentibacter pneumotropicus]